MIERYSNYKTLLPGSATGLTASNRATASLADFSPGFATQEVESQRLAVQRLREAQAQEQEKEQATYGGGGSSAASDPLEETTATDTEKLDTRARWRKIVVIAAAVLLVLYVVKKLKK